MLVWLAAGVRRDQEIDPGAPLQEKDNKLGVPLARLGSVSLWARPVGLGAGPP
jgi:hypothetical protein